MTTETERLYPWPTDENAATRDGLVRHFAEQAQLCYGSLDVFESSSREWTQAIEWSVHAYACCLLLQAVCADGADETAKQLVADLNDGGGPGEWIWRWMTDWGMDPDAIRARGAQMARDQLAKAAAPVAAVSAPQEEDQK